MANLKPDREIVLNGLWRDNPIFRQVLGICSTLAVTNVVLNTVVMCTSLTLVTGLSCLTVSLLR
ncbi:MAG: Rnf-Nqr domain containing protein, partial [Planctomycetota bacterium]